jgi:hypothetical protein
MSLKRSHTLYLQSKHRTTGTTSQYTITLPDLIQSDPNQELFKVSLVAFTTYNDMLQIKDGKDTIRINTTDYTIPHGTYTFQHLSRTLSSLLNVPVIWNTELNAMTFQFPSTTTIEFDGIAYILGFDADTSYTGTQITSVRAMKPYEPTHAIIHLNNVSPVEDHLCLSNHTGDIRVANVLAKVLINASPFQLITYNQVLETEGLYTPDNSLQSLEFLITNNDGVEMTDMTEHELVLRIESVDIENYEMKDVIRELKEIRSTLKDTMLMKALRFRQ